MHASLPRYTMLLLPLGGLFLASCAKPIRQEGGFVTSRQAAMGPAVTAETVDQTVSSMFVLMAPAYLYYVENDRWPTDGQDLARVAHDWDLPFDLSEFALLEMRELEDGRLLVRFQLAPPQQGQGEFMLSPPEIEQEIDGSGRMMM